MSREDEERWIRIRGTLAYYFVAVIFGSFIVSLTLVIGSVATGVSLRIGDFLFSFLFGSFLGAADAVVFAFLLRRMIRLLKTQSIWVWLLGGAGIALAFAFVVTWIAETLQLANGDKGFVLGMFWDLFANTADALWMTLPPWLITAEGAAGGVVLCLVDRAFASPAKTIDSGTNPTPAS